MPVNLPEFDKSVPLTEENRTATYTFHVWWKTVVRNIQAAFTAIEEALDAAGIALDAAEAAQEAADDAQTAANDAQAAADAVQDQVDNLSIPPTGSRTVTTNDNINQDDATILVDATGGAVTLSLYPAGAFLSPVIVKKIDASANVVNVSPTGSDTLNGSGSSVTLTTQYETKTFAADGVSAWFG